MSEQPAKSSDLGVRIASAIAMIALAGGAYLAGGWAFRILVGAVAVGALWEWRALANRAFEAPGLQTAWTIFGMLYIGAAAACLAYLADTANEAVPVILGVVIATDVGAYFVGRSIGGPKIAPAISPSKTWAGLIGGMTSAALFLAFCMQRFGPPVDANLLTFALFGAALAVVAQAGDFLESWLKRKAGVKDSGALIPGHGGLLDRMDGMLPVIIICALALACVGRIGLS